LNVNKVGHTGTLDPIATGLLPICLGRATKLANMIMTYKKVYDVWARFGRATDSHDRTGETIDEKPWEHITEAQVLEAIQTFLGEIPQLPPMFSAIKYQGRPLYWYAHKGIMISNRKERTCTIYSYKLVDWQPPRARFLIECSHGTYVRTLMHELGIKLGSAAVVDELRRTVSGPFDVSQAITLAELESVSIEERLGKVMNMSEALPELPNFMINLSLAERIKAGRTVMWSDIRAGRTVHDAEEQETPAVFKLTTPAGELVAIASLADNWFGADITGSAVLANRVVRTLRVFQA
jgi:tRNA pseudouridine55 synthase